MWRSKNVTNPSINCEQYASICWTVKHRLKVLTTVFNQLVTFFAILLPWDWMFPPSLPPCLIPSSFLPSFLDKNDQNRNFPLPTICQASTTFTYVSSCNCHSSSTDQETRDQSVQMYAWNWNTIKSVHYKKKITEASFLSRWKCIFYV